MMRVLIQNWWLLALRGFLALVFAALAFSMRGMLNAYFINAIAFVTLVVVFGLLALAAGVCTIAAGARGAAQHEKTWWLIADGLVLSTAGLVAATASKLSLSAVGHVVAISALVIGMCELFLAGRIRRHVPDEWFLALSGIRVSLLRQLSAINVDARTICYRKMDRHLCWFHRNGNSGLSIQIA